MPSVTAVAHISHARGKHQASLSQAADAAQSTTSKQALTDGQNGQHQNDLAARHVIGAYQSLKTAGSQERKNSESQSTLAAYWCTFL